MKKILSLILVVVMCAFNLVTVATAESNEITFSMMTNTGIINLESKSSLNMKLAPDVVGDDSIVIATTDVIPNISSVKLIIEGEKYQRNYISKDEYNFANYADINCTIGANGNGKYWKLGVSSMLAHDNELLISNYTYIYSMTIVANGYFTTNSSQVYYNWGTTNFSTDDIPAFMIIKNFSNATNTSAVISELVSGIKSFKYVSKEVKNDYPFLATTDLNSDGIITRNEIVRLSYSEYGTGKGVAGFEGLASQIAGFFNKQTNGTITFKVTTAPAVITGNWSAGIPVPNNFMNTTIPDIKNNVIGLFFNYETTGNLMTPATINDNGEIVFDITNVLKDVNSNTIALINSVHYGLVGGMVYKEMPTRGIKIEQITLAYTNEDKVVETTIIDDTTEPITEPTTVETIVENVDTEDEDETTVAIEDSDDDDDDAVIITDDTEDDTDAEIVDDTIEIINDTTPVETDENPNTGISLFLAAPVLCVAVGIASRKRTH